MLRVEDLVLLKLCFVGASRVVHLLHSSMRSLSRLSALLAVSVFLCYAGHDGFFYLRRGMVQSDGELRMVYSSQRS